MILRLVADNRSIPALAYLVVILVAGSDLKSALPAESKLPCIDLGLT